MNYWLWLVIIGTSSLLIWASEPQGMTARYGNADLFISQQSTGFRYVKGIDDHFTELSEDDKEKQRQFYLESVESYRHFHFYCPGDSLLIGMGSHFHHELKERRFQFICAFLYNHQKQPLVKKTCKIDKDPDEDGVAYSHCADNQALGGWQTHANVSKRHYSSQCCQMTDHYDDWEVNAAQCSNEIFSELQGQGQSSEQTQAGKAFKAYCGPGKVVTKIYSTRHGSDFSFKFRCCPIRKI